MNTKKGEAAEARANVYEDGFCLLGNVFGVSEASALSYTYNVRSVDFMNELLALSVKATAAKLKEGGAPSREVLSTAIDWTL